ncbi:hypothetical protein L1F30_02045 [Simiduia sp. 21SJ11W-1]|uniref:hypothetical protein n=1 Tax=Simiduia sp. 21SJ11W-1 TaxID=2909669 RepID=UPI00209D64B7|nr:hypothetical protein [Simiduia sp. 21SJ11W-1]UTA48337.1 hypothetical protein L1F30_02045 [Simiduia sp. 21SJ11W-1]
MNKIQSFVLTLFINFFISMDAFACSCFSDAKSMSEVIDSQVAVFSGVILQTELIENEWNEAYYKSRLKLTAVWKLESDEKVVTIRSATEISSCGGPPPKVGDEYVVFSHAILGGAHSTGACSQFSNIENRNEAVLEFIQELGSPMRVYEN